MFGQLSTRLEEVFRRLRSRGILSEADIDTCLKDIRLALLEADVHFKVVKTFLDCVRQKAIGLKVRESLTPGQQVIKIVWEELREVLGGEVPPGRPLKLIPNPPTLVMLVGLQGAGKTTTAAKLARLVKQEGRRVLLAAVDIKRPAAVEQLVALGKQISVDVHAPALREGKVSVQTVCEEAARRGRDGGYDLVIFDTAGRLHIDDEMMEELKSIKKQIHPHESLLVVDAMTGQDAVQIGQRFHEAIGLGGVILTKLDGDARGGGLLSIRAVTGLPIKYIGVGEKVDGLEPFYPDRMASRILGMGDVLTLIERADQAFSKSQAVRLESTSKKKGFTLEDFHEQLRGIKEMGPLDKVAEMLPGGGKLREAMNGDHGSGDKELKRMEAIMDSMTLKERRDSTVINGSRRKRIARGSGTTVQDVNRLFKQFLQAKKMMKAFSQKKGRSDISRLLRTV